MEPLRLLQKAIDYVEEHLQMHIEIDDIAKGAMSSKYHFQRIQSVFSNLFSNSN